MHPIVRTSLASFLCLDRPGLGECLVFSFHAFADGALLFCEYTNLGVVHLPSRLLYIVFARVAQLGSHGVEISEGRV